MDVFKKSNKKELKSFARNITQLRKECGITEKGNGASTPHKKKRN